MKRRFFLLLLLLVALLAACGPSAGGGLSFPPEREALDRALTELGGGWQTAEGPEIPSGREAPPGYESPVQTGVFPIVNDDGRQGFVNATAYGDDPLPDGSPAKALNLSFTPAALLTPDPEQAARVQTEDEPRFWRLAGRLLDEGEAVDRLAEEIGGALAAADLSAVESLVCYGRREDLLCRSAYGREPDSGLLLLERLDLWQAAAPLTYWQGDFAALFPSYGWPKDLTDPEALAAGSPQEKCLCLGRLTALAPGETGLFYSEALGCHLLGRAWEGTLTDDSGAELAVTVLPTPRSSDELMEDLLHLVRFMDGRYVVELSAPADLRFRL